MTIKPTRAEQETIINFSAADTTANIYSADPAWISKIKKLGKCRELGVGVETDVPKAWIRIQKPPRMSPEAKQAAAERLRAINKKKKQS